jgi:hypothetical protein
MSELMHYLGHLGMLALLVAGVAAALVVLLEARR